MRRAVQVWALCFLSAAIGGCKQEGTITVHSITFKGVHGVDENRLKTALATRENAKIPLVGWELPWGRKNYFDRARFDTDLKRITAFYADRGYPDARVTGVEPKLNAKQDSIDVTVTVDEGDPVLVAGVEFVGFEVLSDRRQANLKRNAPLAVGRPRDRQVVVTTHEMAVNELRNYGYPYAQVATEETDGTTGKEATVVFKASPGLQAHFGPVEITGEKTVTENVIRRELDYKQGDLYRRNVLQNTQRRLYGMELFQFVNIEPVTTSDQSPEVPTKITVAEGKHQRVNFGIGYGTEERARFDGEYHHVNFFGGARTAGLHARWSRLDRGVRADFTQPYFFAPHFSLGVEGQQWYTYTPAYNSTTRGAKATVTHREGTRLSLSGSMTVENNSSTISEAALNDPTLVDDLIALGLDPNTGTQSGLLTSIGFDVLRSTADSILNARRGYQLAAHLEEAGLLLPGSFNYLSLTADGRHYVSLNRSLVVANRLQLGNISPVNGTAINVPFSKRYFLGGASSLRGWGRYEVSPLSDTGIPLGGNSLLSFTSELRAVVHGSLGAVLFVDMGNVWLDSWGIKLGDLRYDIGPGVRYDTPIGPLRFDIGYQLNPIPNLTINGQPQTQRFRIHFSIGQSF
jgi:outer membrane protein assembly complex protein YaeT